MASSLPKAQWFSVHFKGKIIKTALFRLKKGLAVFSKPFRYSDTFKISKSRFGC
jgi:hypothetical protein